MPADADGREALDQLSRIPLRITELERAEFSLISRARQGGASWGDVAQSLGVATEVKRRTRPFRRAYGALWSELVAQAIDAGELRKDVDRYLIRLFLVNTVEFAAVWARRVHRPLPELAATIERLIMEGAGTSPYGGRRPS